MIIVEELMILILILKTMKVGGKDVLEFFYNQNFDQLFGIFSRRNKL